MIFFLFFFIRTRPTRQPLFHPRPVRMQTNRGIVHGSNSSVELSAPRSPQVGKGMLNAAYLPTRFISVPGSRRRSPERSRSIIFAVRASFVTGFNPDFSNCAVAIIAGIDRRQRKSSRVEGAGERKILCRKMQIFRSPVNGCSR